MFRIIMQHKVHSIYVGIGTIKAYVSSLIVWEGENATNMLRLQFEA